MTDTITQSKLVQYLSEAYGKEKELETALEAHIGMTTRKPYKKRLQEHLKETKAHARELERRIKQLGGGGAAAADKVAGQAVGKAKSLAKGPLHMVRGTGEAEKMLKNAKTEYFNEHEEIATYTAIETLAESVGDAETAKLARAIRRDEERMANFLAKQIPVLTKAVVDGGDPGAGTAPNGAGRRRRRSASTSKSRTGSTGKTAPRQASRAAARARSPAVAAARPRRAASPPAQRDRRAPVRGALGGLAQPVAEVRVGDLGQRQAALVHGQPLELGGAVLGDDHVDLVARGRDHRAGLEPGHDPRAQLARERDGRGQAEQRAVLERERRAGDEVLVAADPRVLAAVDRVGDHLAVDVDRDRGVDRHHHPVAADQVG